MTRLPAIVDRTGGTRIVITDSGLGGLLIAAGLELRLRESGGRGPIRLIYVNAWPDARHGYNDLPDLAARASVFDRALAAMMGFRPRFVLIACNTLSVVYQETAFSRSPAVPVTGILDTGTDLFYEALARDPAAVLTVFGTRTTIGSGEHVRRLVGRGIDPRRLASEACHGLAAAIDKDPDAADIPGLVDACVLRALPRIAPAATVYAGLACTHYAYVAEVFAGAISRHAGVRVEILDPGERLVERSLDALSGPLPGSGKECPPVVEVVSKVELPQAQRLAVARRLEAISPATAHALLAYRHAPDLF